MLGKLIKNSFKSNASAVYNVYIAAGVIGAIMLVMLLFDWTKWGDKGVTIGLVIKGIAAFALCATALVAVIITLVAVIGDFNRSMYGNEGYLTLTLPVKSSSLIISKWISGSFWVIVSYLLLVIAVFGSAIYMMRHSISVAEDMGFREMIDVIIQELCAAAGIVTPPIGVLLNICLMYALEGGIRICVFVLLTFFASTMSHCRPWSKSGRPGRLLWFFGSGFALIVFSGIVTKLLKVYIVISDTYYTITLSQSEVAAAWKLGFGAYSVTDIYCTVIGAIFIYLITVNLIENKVNAD